MTITMVYKNNQLQGETNYNGDYNDLLLRYDMVELLETGRGAECGLRKSRNGIGVFHYVG